MKKTTPASRAPGVSSVGIIRAASASISAACSGVKYSNFGGSANCDECCACRVAARMAGQLAVTHAAETAVVLLNRNFRRENQSCTREPSESRAFNCRFSNKKGQEKEYRAEWTRLLPALSEVKPRSIPGWCPAGSFPSPPSQQVRELTCPKRSNIVTHGGITARKSGWIPTIPDEWSATRKLVHYRSSPKLDTTPPFALNSYARPITSKVRSALRSIIKSSACWPSPCSLPPLPPRTPAPTSSAALLFSPV